MRYVLLPVLHPDLILPPLRSSKWGLNMIARGYALMGFTPGYHLFAPLVLLQLITADTKTLCPYLRQVSSSND